MKMRNMKSQGGFTLIELLAVMVILGILAAAAIPQFADLSDEAKTASVMGMAGSIESASNLNHAVNLAVRAGLSTDTVYGTRNVACSAAAANVLASTIPADYTVAGGTTANTEGAPHTCNISRTGASAVNFVIIAATAAN